MSIDGVMGRVVMDEVSEVRDTLYFGTGCNYNFRSGLGNALYALETRRETGEEKEKSKARSSAQGNSIIFEIT